MVNKQLIHRLSRLKGAQAIRLRTIGADVMCQQGHHATVCTANPLGVLPESPRRSPTLSCYSRLHSTWTRSAISSSNANLSTKKHDSSAIDLGPNIPTLSSKSRIPTAGGSSKVTRNEVDAIKLTQKLLSAPFNFETSLQNARNNEALLKSLGLSSSDAQSMFILPPDLLKDVHLAISHFSKVENFPGISLDHRNIPGPIICARLLDLMGIPRYYSDLVAASGSSPIVNVHSSQIDDVLHCCLQTTLALSSSCKVGRGSLIGTDFNFNSNAVSDEEKKTAAHLAEEIWNTVWNMQIKFTFEQKSEQSEHNGPVMTMPNLFMSMLGAMNKNVIQEYLNPDNSPTQHPSVSWSRKDQRRYKQSISLFNATLSAYARLGSSASGIRQEVRREMVQAAERLLLELAAKRSTIEPSPSTILQCTRPDVISFNTAMNAWVQLSPRGKNGAIGNEDASMTTLTAERTHAILQMMQEMWDEERTNRSTRQTVEADWKEYGDGEQMYKSHAVPPNTSSYNTVLNAWSRSSSSNAMDKAMEVFRTMVERCNLSCSGRVSLMRQNSNLQHAGKADLEGDHASPDSRTFVALLNCCSNHSKFMGYEEAVGLIETIFETMKYWDEQLQWSASEEILPHGLMKKYASTSPILNEFALISLVKAFSAVTSTSLDESLQCCNRIEEIISRGMNTNAITRGMAINAWAKCLEYAKDDDEKKRLCVERALNHLDIMLESDIDDSIPNAKSIILDSLCQVLRMFGNASMPDEANELFQRAKLCGMSNLSTISTAIDVLAGSKDLAQVEKAMGHLLDLEREMMGKSINPSTKHDYTRMYNACISGFINAEQDGSRRAHALLWHMIENYSRNSLHIARPNTTSFAYVMNPLAQQGRSKEVEALLSKMEEIHQCRHNSLSHRYEKDLDANVVPNIVHYNTLMTSYARSDDMGAIQSANTLLHRMENFPNVPSPDAVTRSLTLKIHNRLSSKGPEAETSRSDNTVTNDLNVDDIIANTINQNQMHLSAKSFNSIMKALAHSGTIKGAEKSAALLSKMEEMYAAGDIRVRPDIILYNLVLNAWQLCEPNDEDVSISPAEKAEQTLDAIIHRYESGNNDVAPNDATFSICIHAWCKSNRPDAAARAERILRQKEAYLNRVEGLLIRATDFNSIISKWRDDPDKGPAHASEIFEAMTQKCNESTAYQCPTTVTFNSLLAVFAKSNDETAAEKAEEYLRRMNDLSAAEKTDIQPDMISYRTCIDAWIRRKNSLSPTKVEALVQDLIYKYQNQGRDDLQPDSNVLDLILKACNLVPITWNMNKEEKGRDQTIDIANRTFTLLRGNEFNAQPTHSTYAFMFRILHRHMNFADPRYDLLMKSLWTQCCRDGLVSEFTLESLRKSVTDSTFFECIGHERSSKPESVTVASLHRDWRRNVAAKRESAPPKKETA